MKPSRWRSDPVMPSFVLAAGLVVAGFGSLYLGWMVAARTLVVAFQTPAVVSGGFGGLTLIAVGTSLARIQMRRRFAASERAEMDALLDELAAVIRAVRTTHRPP